MDRLMVIVMAGGVGERLQPLTMRRAKSAVPFGGKFRLIDFTLSNCINSGIRQIYVLIQYRSWSLQRHIQEGWSISSSGLGDYIYCVPAQQKLGMEWYRGTADAIRQNLDLVQGKGLDNVLILPGDHICKMNYMQMATYHRLKNSDVTISVTRVKKELAAGQLGVLEVDKDYRIVGFEEKPAQPKTLPDVPGFALASMGIYTFKVGTLLRALQEPGDDFGREIIPKLLGKDVNIFAYDYEKENRVEDFVVQVEQGKRRKVLVERTRDSSYWMDVGTIDAYYQASMDLVGVDPGFNLYGEKWPFRTYQKPLPPSKCVLGGRTLESIISDGCIISGGTVHSSILSPSVVVERDAFVDESIILDDVTIEPYARVRRAIVDKESRIQSGTSIGYDHEADRRRGCAISDAGIVVVPRATDIGV